MNGYTTSTASDTTTTGYGFGTIYIRIDAPEPPPPVVQGRATIHPCAVLGVPCEAPLMQVKSAYRKLAMQHHPDRGGDKRKMALLNDAYAMLRDAKEGKANAS